MATAMGDRKRQIAMIGKTFGHMRGRNESIYAHGLRRLDANTYGGLKSIVREWAEALCTTEGRYVEELLRASEFVSFAPTSIDAVGKGGHF